MFARFVRYRACKGQISVAHQLSLILQDELADLPSGLRHFIWHRHDHKQFKRKGPARLYFGYATFPSRRLAQAQNIDFN
jgi:hypothetical protein